jgi:hypothetical protein
MKPRKLAKRVALLERQVARLTENFVLLEGDLNMHLDGYVYDKAGKTWVKRGTVTFTMDRHFRSDGED